MSTAIQTQLPTGTWTADPVHSEIGFGIEYMAGTFGGQFASFSVQVEDDELRGSVEVSSVQVKDPNLEAHLQSPEFFDAERHPQLTFRSERIERSGDDVTIDGELTIKGVTRPVTFSLEVNGFGPDAYGGTRAGFSATAEIDRKDFGITTNIPMDGGGVVIGDRIQIYIEIEAILSPPEPAGA
jgi:polyisoprenoid-binding protein YceI